MAVDEEPTAPPAEESTSPEPAEDTSANPGGEGSGDEGAGKGARSREGQIAESSLLSTIGLVSGVLGLTALVFGVVLYAIDPSAATLFGVNLIFSAVTIVFYGATNWSAMTRKLSGRSTALAVLEVVLVIGVLAAIVGANFFAAQSQKEWDLTYNEAFSLEEQSIKVAKGLKSNVKIIAFYRSADQLRTGTARLVELYQTHTDKISLEFISPDKIDQATLAKYSLGAQSPRIIVLDEATDKHTKVPGPSEEGLTNALLQLGEDRQRKVYFLTGHGEGSGKDSKSDSGFANAAQSLLDEGYELDKLSLIDRENVPKDTTVLLVPGPKSQLFPNEVAAILDYLKRGGRAVFLLDFGAEPKVDEILRPFGVVLGDNLIVDPSPAAQMLNMGPDAIIIKEYEQHPIMEPLIRNPRALLFYSARSVSPRLGVARIEVTTLLRTSPASWGETKYEEASRTYALDEEDMPGPIPVALSAVKRTATVGQKLSDEARLVVFGDSSFASNRFSTIGGNSDLFVNAVNWAAGEEERIVLRPKKAVYDPLPLTKNQQYSIVFFSVNLLPLLIVGIGFSVWAVRRRK